MNYTYCPRCATPLQHIEKAGAMRPVCPACGFVYFADPKVTVCTLVAQESKVLLGRRVMEPQRGKWCLPGGFMDYGEQVRAAAAREIREETGLEVEIGELLLLGDWNDPVTGKKGIVLTFLGTILAGTLRADDDISELAWFSVEALPEMAFPLDVAAIEKYQNLLHQK